MKRQKLCRNPFVPTRHRVRVVLRALGERLAGLDFSMPDRMYDRGRNDGAMYLATESDMLEKFLECASEGDFDCFLDVGCGKGYVLWKAAAKGFRKVGGIEYDARLFEICKKNINRLKLEERVNVVCCDAVDFRDYGSYDVFYFFNPFMEDVMEQVMSRITEQCCGKEIMLIYNRPRYAGVIEAYPWFVRTARFYDSEKDYEAFVYQGRIPENNA